MDSEALDLSPSEGERFLGENSNKTPTPSSPDTKVTSTVSCPSGEECVLRGDYEMEFAKGHPHLTLALIKPDGMKYIKAIEKRMKDEGFGIVQKRTLRLSPEQASNFYAEHYGQPYFPELVLSMCEDAIGVYVLRRRDAVPTWKHVCGPTCVTEAKKKWPDSLRAMYGTLGENAKNVCHASSTEAKAREEIKFFFPNMVLDDNFKREEEVEDYLKESVNAVLLEGLTQVCKFKPLDPVVWLATWLLTHNPNKPKLAEDIAVTLT